MRTLSVLIVDDDDADSLIIEEALEASPMAPVIHRVADGVQALEYLRDTSTQRPDLILLDLNMPRMGGREVLAEIKNDADLKTIPVVVLTTSQAELDVMASYNHHANAFVTKPLELEAFENAVRQINRFYGDIAVLP
ncbi:response regulator [Actinoplanes sp. CA-015351]|uniref:response regulator n=1 Tax=Actinoplanes sp. CA-015351 TaxID=3239897 RepID=UPI003D96A77F